MQCIRVPLSCVDVSMVMTSTGCWTSWHTKLTSSSVHTRKQSGREGGREKGIQDRMHIHMHMRVYCPVMLDPVTQALNKYRHTHNHRRTHISVSVCGGDLCVLCIHPWMHSGGHSVWCRGSTRPHPTRTSQHTHTHTEQPTPIRPSICRLRFLLSKVDEMPTEEERIKVNHQLSLRTRRDTFPISACARLCVWSY